MDPERHAVGQFGAELLQDRPRLVDGARAVRLGFIPVRRQAEDGPGIAGTQRTDDDVVNAVSVFDRHQLGSRHRDIQLRRGGRPVGEQAFLVGRVGPRLGDDLGAFLGAPGIEKLHVFPDFGSGHQAFLDAQLLERIGEQFEMSGLIPVVDRVVGICKDRPAAVVMSVVIGVAGHHASPSAGHSQCS